MLKIWRNNLVEEINKMDDESIKSMQELIFTTKDIHKLEVLKHVDFKYRPFEEYKFIEFAVYKLYCNELEELFNIVRLNEYQIEDIQEMKKISDKLIKISSENEINLSEYAEIVSGFDSDIKTLYEDESFILQSYFEEEENIDILLYKEKEKEAYGYDYAEWCKKENIKNVIETMFDFSPEHNSYYAQNEKEIFLVDTKKIEKFLYDNYTVIEENCGISGLAVKLYTKNDLTRFGKKATKTEYCIEHSWAGCKYNEVSFYTLEGSIQYGIDTEYVYSNNGNTGTPDIVKSLPDFKIDSNIMFIRKNKYYDSLSGNMDDTVTKYYDYELIIYKGMEEK